MLNTLFKEAHLYSKQLEFGLRGIYTRHTFVKQIKKNAVNFDLTWENVDR